MDWQAKWIWAESLLNTPNCYVYARREFEVESAPSADVCVTCSSDYRLYANGRYIGRGPNICDPSSQCYDTYDLSHVLRPGKNVLAAICYNYGVEIASRPQSPGGFLLQLTIRRNGEQQQILATDEAWRTLPARDWDFGSARMSSAGGFQEVYDSRKKPVGWNVVGFDDSEWEPAFVIGEVGCEPWTSLVPRQIPALKEWEVHPQQMLACGTASPIDDSSLDVATRIYAEPTHNDPSAVSYTKEMLRPSGDVSVVNPGPDSFVVFDYGSEVVGFPAIKIRGAGSATIDIGYSEALDEHGRVCPTRQGILQADRLILHGGRQEWHAFGRRTFRYAQLTFRDVETPISIELVYLTQVGYPVEAVSTFKCSDELLNEIWRTGVYTLSVCMQDTYEDSPLCKRAQRPRDMRVQALANFYCFFDTALASSVIDELSQRVQPDVGWVVILHDYYLHTADIGLVTQLYPRVKALIDQTPDIADYTVLRDAEKIAAAMSRSEDALRWHERAGELRPSPGDLIPECSGPQSGFYTLQALARENRTQEALDLIRSRWGDMLRLGATTWWEAFATDGLAPSGSLCSGSSCAPTHFLGAEILGVKPSTPGGGVVIQPRAGDLAFAEGRIKTIAGFVDVQWQREDDHFSLEIEGPEGFITALPVAGFTNAVIDEIDLTPETPERRARRTYGWGNTIWRDGEEHDPYLDWLATQETPPPSGYKRRERCSEGEAYVWVRESVSTHVRYEVREG